MRLTAVNLREIFIVAQVKLQKSHYINILYTADKKFNRQLPFIPSYFHCYGEQVTMATEGCSISQLSEGVEGPDLV